MLFLSYQDDSRVLEKMVQTRQAENLEYAVIDLGLNLTASRVALHGQTLPLKEALQRLGEQGDSDVQDFVQSYLSDLSDEDFNPNLRVSLK